MTNLDDIIEWTNKQLSKVCPHCSQPLKIVKHNDEAVMVIDHESFCKYSHLNMKRDNVEMIEFSYHKAKKKDADFCSTPRTTRSSDIGLQEMFRDREAFRDMSKPMVVVYDSITTNR